MKTGKSVRFNLTNEPESTNIVKNTGVERTGSMIKTKSSSFYGSRIV
jgi:hypothetical protein